MTTLERSIARVTGEDHRTLRRLGFQLDRDQPLESEDPRLVVRCPACGQDVPYPGRLKDGSPLLAECSRPTCDLFFEFREAEVRSA